MALPNPGMNFTPGTILPASDMNDIVENIESLADGSGIDNGAITGSKIAPTTVTSNNINLSSFAVPVMMVNATHPSGQTTNNNIYKMTAVESLYNATGSNAATDSSGRVKITLPNTGTYVLKAQFQSWINDNSFDYLRFDIRKLSGSTTTTFAIGMAYKGGAWGHFNLAGVATIKNDDLVFVHLNTNGHNFSDGNVNPTNTHLMLDIYKTS